MENGRALKRVKRPGWARTVDEQADPDQNEEKRNVKIAVAEAHVEGGQPARPAYAAAWRPLHAKLLTSVA
jgi:hypothetical protein